MEKYLKKLLACPLCKNANLAIDEKQGIIYCRNCQEEYLMKNSIPLMLPRNKRNEFGKYIKIMETAEQRGTIFEGTSWSEELVELIPGGTGYCLDIGCGKGVRKILEPRGYKYIGLDLCESKGATVYGDSQMIPLAPESMDLVTSVGVMEHIPDPWKANAEIYQVLKKGGLYVGAVAFLQPFHMNSHFHFTHLGLTKILQDSGFQVELLKPSSRTGMEALLEELFKLKVLLALPRLVLILAFCLRRFIIGRVIIKMMKDPLKITRGKEFLQEEQYRFSDGFFFKAIK